jgi:hypothetical protein
MQGTSNQDPPATTSQFTKVSINHQPSDYIPLKRNEPSQEWQ